MRKLRNIFAMILSLVMVITLIPVSSNIEQVNAANEFAITSPTANELKAAGYINIEWTAATAGIVSNYEVYIDGSKVATTTSTSCEYYTTKVETFNTYVKANYTNGTSETTDVISFGVSKKGLGLASDMGRNLDIKDMGVAWYYNWGESPSSGAQYEGIEYVPMVWKETSASNLQSRVTTLKDKGYKYVLTFNEPDIVGQAEMSVDEVREVWQGLDGMTDIKISSPVTALWPSISTNWFQPFMTKVDENGDYQPDFISIHCYPAELAGTGAAEWFLTEVVDWTWETYGLPIWITEFSTTGSSVTATGSNGTKEFWEAVMPGLDEREYVERYAAFGFNSASNSNTGLWNYSTGELTQAGEIYKSSGNPKGYTLLETERWHPLGTVNTTIGDDNQSASSWNVYTGLSWSGVSAAVKGGADGEDTVSVFVQTPANNEWGLQLGKIFQGLEAGMTYSYVINYTIDGVEGKWVGKLNADINGEVKVIKGIGLMLKAGQTLTVTSTSCQVAQASDYVLWLETERNLAYGKSSSVSNFKEGNNDNVTLTDGVWNKWSGSYVATYTPGYFEVDLGQLYAASSIDQVVVWFRNGDKNLYPENGYKIQFGDTTFETVATVTEFPEGADATHTDGTQYMVATELDKDNLSGTVRKVRIQIDDAVAWGAQITEIAVFSKVPELQIPSTPTPTGLSHTPAVDGLSPYNFTWQAVEGASYYNIYINDILVGTSQTTSYDAYSYFISATPGNYTISVSAVDKNYGIESEKTSIEFEAEELKPIVSVDGNYMTNLQWDFYIGSDWFFCNGTLNQDNGTVIGNFVTTGGNWEGGEYGIQATSSKVIVEPGVTYTYSADIFATKDMVMRIFASDSVDDEITYQEISIKANETCAYSMDITSEDQVLDITYALGGGATGEVRDVQFTLSNHRIEKKEIETTPEPTTSETILPIKLTPWQFYQAGNLFAQYGEPWNIAAFNSIITTKGELLLGDVLDESKGEITVSTIQPADGFTADIKSNGFSANWDNHTFDPWMLRAYMQDVKIQEGHNYTVSFKIKASKGKYAYLSIYDEYEQSLISESDTRLIVIDTEEQVLSYSFTSWASSNLYVNLSLGSFVSTTDYDGTDRTNDMIYGTESMWSGTVNISDFTIVDDGIHPDYVEPATPTTPEPTTPPTEPGPLEVVGLSVTKQNDKEVSFMWSQNFEQILLGQSYKVYIDGELYNQYPSPTTITYTFETAGIHTIKVTGVLNGIETEGVTVEVNIPEDDTTPEETTPEENPDDITISDDLSITGFQMSSSFNGVEGSMGFRTVYQIEDMVDGKDVTEVGLLYGLVYGDNPITASDVVYGSDNPFVASYVATETGRLNYPMGASKTATYYARTMACGSSDGNISTDAYTSEYYVRAYAILEDGSIVYSNERSFTIFKIADTLYKSDKISKKSTFDCIYNNILKYVDPTYIEREFDWSNILV